MEAVRVYLLPLVLGAGALVLVTLEVAALLRYRRWVRFLRRFAGGALMMVIAAMLHRGQAAPPPHGDHQAALEQLSYWQAVLGLVAGTVLLALWDMVEGIQGIRQFIDEVERDEIRTLREHLR